MDVVISGSSGLIGTALQDALRSAGHRPIPLVRGEPGPDEIGWKPDEAKIDAAGLAGVDAVVHLAGAGIGDERWTDERKRVLVESRTQGTSLLASTLASLNDKPNVFVSASAIGYYGDRGNEVLTEDSLPGAGFLADLAQQWEAAAGPAESAGIRTVNLRTGIIQTDEGGALSKMLWAFKLGVGGPILPGTQWMSWISFTDEIQAIIHILEGDLSGPVNVVAPNPVRNRDHAKALGRALHRPVVFPIPQFAPKVLYGSELVEELITFSQRVQATKLEESGFEFKYPDLDEALSAELS